VKRRLTSSQLTFCISLNPCELLETLAARQEYQRPNEQAYIEDDRRRDNRPTYHPAGMQVIPDVD
jgi:hypothetical protein